MSTEELIRIKLNYLEKEVSDIKQTVRIILSILQKENKK